MGIISLQVLHAKCLILCGIGRLQTLLQKCGTIEVGPCGLNCHKPKPNSTRNIIPSAADFDINIYIYIY